MIRLPVAPDRWSLEYQRQINAAVEKAINDLTASSDQRLSTQNHEAAKATKVVRVESVSGVATFDARLSNVFRIVLTEDTLISNPDSMLDGQVINIIIKQDATGGWTPTFGDKYRWVNKVDPVPTTDPNATDLISMQYDLDSDEFDASYLPNFGTGGTAGSGGAGYYEPILDFNGDILVDDAFNVITE